MRLNAIAAERAPTIATTIQSSFHAESVGREPSSRIASSAPVSANGSANTECSNLIISSVSRILVRNRAGCGVGWVASKECSALVLS